MLDVLERKIGVAREVLLGEIKQVHQTHSTVEYAFLIDTLPSLKGQVPRATPQKYHAEAIRAYRVARAKSLRLYPGVAETLRKLKAKGCVLIGYTESMESYSNYRMRNLGLDLLLDYLYAPADHELPDGFRREGNRKYPFPNHRLRKTKNRHTPKGETKPNPDLLLAMIDEVGGEKDSTVYIGDSLVKDVGMAQKIGVADVWAKYGVPQQREEYELLRRVTHWSDEVVHREKRASTRAITPNYVLQRSFAELWEMFEFAAPRQGE